LAVSVPYYWTHVSVSLLTFCSCNDDNDDNNTTNTNKVVCYLCSLGSCNAASVSRVYLANLWSSPASDEIFRVEGNVSVVCKIVLQCDNRLCFTASATLVCHLCNVVSQMYCVKKFLDRDAINERFLLILINLKCRLCNVCK